ncbi:LOW QUALITY PROTEIN: uncharacterized protein V1477_017606 [Vespula maculifrons]|uniref:Uncharacterized protein n=1 Tax=Vespula maculifrons TaxID=7453 RepID=A0ABD2B6H6_VESMC
MSACYYSPAGYLPVTYFSSPTLLQSEWASRQVRSSHVKTPVASSLVEPELRRARHHQNGDHPRPSPSSSPPLPLSLPLPPPPPPPPSPLLSPPLPPPSLCKKRQITADVSVTSFHDVTATFSTLKKLNVCIKLFKVYYKLIREYHIHHSQELNCEGYVASWDDNKVESLTNFDNYWFSLVLNFDEYASQFWQDAFRRNLNWEVGILDFLLLQSCFEFQRVHIAVFLNEMVKWGYSPTRDENKVGLLTDFDTQFRLEFRRVHIAVLPWGYSASQDDNKIGPSNNFDSYCFSLALNFDEYTSQFSQYAFSVNNNEELMQVQYYIIHIFEILCKLFDFRLELRSGDTRLRETTTKSDLRTTLTWGYSASRDDNKIGPSNDFNSYCFSLVLNFDEYTSQFSQYAFSVNNNEELILELRSGDTRLRETTTKSDLRTTLTVTASFSQYAFSVSNNEELILEFQSGDTRLRETTTKSDLRTTLTVTASFSQYAFSVSNNEELILELRSGDTRLRETTTKSDLRTTLTVTASWGYSASRDDNKIGPSNDFNSYCFSLALNFDEYTSQFSQYAFSVSNNEELILEFQSGDTRLRETTTKSDLRTTLTVTASWGYSASRDDNKIGPSNDFDSYCFSLPLNFDEYTSQFSQYAFSWGYSASRDDNKIGPSNDFNSYCFSLALNFDEYTSQFSQYAFSVSNNEELIAEWGYSASRDDNKIGPSNDFSSYCFSLALNFDEYTSQFSQYAFSVNNNEELRLELRSGILGFTNNLSPRVDLEIFGLSRNFGNLSPRVDLEIFTDNLPPRVDLEIFGLSRNFDNLSPRTDNLPPRVDLEIFGLSRNFDNLSPRVDLEIFAGRHSNDQCFTEEDLDQLRCRPTSFSTNYKSSTLNFDLSRGPVFWSRRRTSKVLWLGHEAKKRLCAEKAPTNCGSRGQLLNF